MTSTIHEGGCLCGRVRYRAAGQPTNVNHCHCRMCRKASGAPVVTWATFPRPQVTYYGAQPQIYRSSAKAVRGFCAACGAVLSWQHDERPDEIDLTVGTLDRPEDVPPSEHLWTESAIAWLNIADGLPRHPRQRGSGKAPA
ncbi:MAG: GFA family protein [Pseudomonadota bacterium]